MTSSGAATTYLYFDGDDVGSGIELHLLGDDVDGAARVSSGITAAIAALTASVENHLRAKIVFAAGDEILALTSLPVDLEQLQKFREEFRAASGLTISCGWARSAREATLNLRIAKLRGKNRLQGPADD